MTTTSKTPTTPKAVQDRRGWIEERGKELGRELKDAGRNVWLAGLGTVAMAEEVGREAFGNLVKRGEKRAKESRKVVAARVREAEEKAKSLGSRIEHKVEKTMSGTLKRLGVPTHEEVQTLIQRIEKLTRKVETLN